MKKIIIALSVIGIALSFSASSFAFTQSECEAKAVSKDGKPIYGAAKDASVKKCLGDAKPDLGCVAKMANRSMVPPRQPPSRSVKAASNIYLFSCIKKASQCEAFYLFILNLCLMDYLLERLVTT